MISAQEAQRRINQELGDKVGKRRVPPVLPSVKRLMENETVHVFNVGPWPHPVFMGSLGRYFIPACEEGQPKEWERNEANQWVPSDFITDPRNEFAAMKPLPGIVQEPVPTDEKQNHWSQDEGRYVAEQIVGIGIQRPKAWSLERVGVFIADKKVPSKKELADAREELRKYMMSMIQEARTAYGVGPKELESVRRAELHDVCARWMNLNDEPWMVHTNPEARQKCPVCSTLTDGGTILCRCGYIFDEAAYAKVKSRMAV